MEHYTARDERTGVIVGRDPQAIAQAVIERGLLGALDHAVYLGRELERAAVALALGRAYVQDGRPSTWRFQRLSVTKAFQAPRRTGKVTQQAKRLVVSVPANR